MGLHSAFATMPIRSKCNYITMRFKKSALCFLNFLCGHIRCWTQPCPFHLPSGNSRPEITWTLKRSILPVYGPYTGITENFLKSDQAKPCKPMCGSTCQLRDSYTISANTCTATTRAARHPHMLDTTSECPWRVHWGPDFCKNPAGLHGAIRAPGAMRCCGCAQPAEQKSSPSSRAACYVPSWSRRHSWCQGRVPGWKQDFPKAPCSLWCHWA